MNLIFCKLKNLKKHCQTIGYSSGTIDEMSDCNDINASCFEIVASGSVFGDSTVLKGCMNAPNNCEGYGEFATTIGATMESCILSDGSAEGNWQNGFKNRQIAI